MTSIRHIVPANFFHVTLSACLLVSGVMYSSGCGERQPATETADETAAVTITAWVHSGQEAERITIQQQVQRFHREQDAVHVDLTIIPEGTYNSQVQAAALANELPDVLEFDGPFVYNYVWQGHLVPIDDLLSAEVMENLIPSIIAQGMYRDEFYAVGMFDSGLGLYGRRSALEAVGARIPDHPSEAWTADEFETILANLAERAEDGQVLDLKLNYDGEWYAYAFSPAIQSAGGDLIDRQDYQRADGVLNSPEAVGVLARFQRWMNEDNYVDPNVDDNAFVGGRVALSWVGHWEYQRYHDAFGDDLVLVPLPDFGEGSKTGQGSWNWGITRRCQHPEAAAAFLDFLLQDRQVLEMSNANGAVPATHSAIAGSDLYDEDSILHLFVTQLRQGYSVPRPATPAYPVITSVFEQAFADVRNRIDPQTALDRAVHEIDRDIRDNEGYPPID